MVIDWCWNICWWMITGVTGVELEMYIIPMMTNWPCNNYLILKRLQSVERDGCGAYEWNLVSLSVLKYSCGDDFIFLFLLWTISWKNQSKIILKNETKRSTHGDHSMQPPSSNIGYQHFLYDTNANANDIALYVGHLIINKTEHQ